MTCRCIHLAATDPDIKFILLYISKCGHEINKVLNTEVSYESNNHELESSIGLEYQGQSCRITCT